MLVARGNARIKDFHGRRPLRQNPGSAGWRPLFPQFHRWAMTWINILWLLGRPWRVLPDCRSRTRLNPVGESGGNGWETAPSSHGQSGSPSYEWLRLLLTQHSSCVAISWRWETPGAFVWRHPAVIPPVAR